MERIGGLGGASGPPPTKIDFTSIARIPVSKWLLNRFFRSALRALLVCREWNRGLSVWIRKMQAIREVNLSIGWRAPLSPGDRSKYLSLIFSVSFATVLMTQQILFFMGIVTRAASQIIDVRTRKYGVMDDKVRFIDEAPSLPVSALSRVRGVDGVEWAIRFHESQSYARLEDGKLPH